jgi:hypothetical protein
MTTSRTSSAPPPTGSAAKSRGLVTAFRGLAALTLVALAFQFVTAGQLFPEGGPEELHAGGAIALHVVSALTAVAAVLLWRRGAIAAWLAGLASLVFALTFVQAALGGRETLWVHVPGAVVLTIGSTWVAARAFAPAGNG